MIAREVLAAVAMACEHAYPHEACGWIDGRGVREARPGSRDGFGFSEADLIALAAARPQALYHSHPDGDAALSARDRETLALHPLPHLVVAVAGGAARAIAVYAWRDGAHVAIAELHRTAAGWTPA